MLTLCALSLAACSPAAVGSTSGSIAAQSVTIVIDPPSIDVLPGDSISFTATVYGTADDRVSWMIDPDGGSIDSLGNYTAPRTEGNFGVTATSLVDPGAEAVATIRVRSGSGATPGTGSNPAATPGTGSNRGPAYLCPSGGTCIGKTVTGGSAAGSISSLIASGYNVMTSGGATGDCSTDDTAAIQAAITTATGLGKAVLFPDPPGGCYKIKGSTPSSLHPCGGTLTVSTSLVGAAGVYPRLQMVAGSSTYGTNCNGTGYVTGSGNNIMLYLNNVITSAGPIIINGLTLDGGYPTTPGSFKGTPAQKQLAYDHAIHLNNANSVTISNNFIQNTAGDGIYMDQSETSGDPSGQGHGSTNVIIDNNTITGPTRCGIVPNATGPRGGAGTLITNNVITDTFGYVIPIDIEPNGPGMSVWNVEITGNVVQMWTGKYTGGAGSCINVNGGGMGTDGGNIFVHKNQYGSPYGCSTNSGGWVYPGYCKNYSNCIVATPPN